MVLFEYHEIKIENRITYREGPLVLTACHITALDSAALHVTNVQMDNEN